MPHEAEPLHRLLAEIGLRAGGPFGFALAGGHAIAAHGIIDRPSEDVDLFADWQRRADFPTAVNAVIADRLSAGWSATVRGVSCAARRVASPRGRGGSR